MLDLNDACLLLSGKRSYVSLYLTKLHRRSATTQTRRACCLSRSPTCVRVDCAKNAAIPRARSPPHDDVLAASRIDVEYPFLQIFWARAGWYGAHLLDDGEIGLESQSCRAGGRAAALCGRVAAATPAIG